MDYQVITYSAYLVISIALTIWVARTLFIHGRRFLIDVFSDEELADSVNHLLVVGFYLVNLGFVSLMLKLDTQVVSTSQIIEALSVKIGTVLLVLGVMHFMNLAVFRQLRTKPTPTEPPAYYPPAPAYYPPGTAMPPMAPPAAAG